MAYSFRHTDPKLAGVLVKEKVRCGKHNCRCIQQGKPHQWYYYLYWRDYQNNRILRKSYIPLRNVVGLRRRIKTIKTKDRAEKVNFQAYLKLFKQLV